MNVRSSFHQLMEGQSAQVVVSEAVVQAHTSQYFGSGCWSYTYSYTGTKPVPQGAWEHVRDNGFFTLEERVLHLAPDSVLLEREYSSPGRNGCVLYLHPGSPLLHEAYAFLRDEQDGNVRAAKRGVVAAGQRRDAARAALASLGSEDRATPTRLAAINRAKHELDRAEDNLKWARRDATRELARAASMKDPVVLRGMLTCGTLLTASRMLEDAAVALGS